MTQIQSYLSTFSCSYHLSFIKSRKPFRMITEPTGILSEPIEVFKNRLECFQEP